MKYYFFSISILQVLIAQQTFHPHVHLSNDSWAIQLSSKTQVTNNFFMFQKYLFTKSNHPRDHYTWHKYQLKDKTFVNEEGFFHYKKEKLDLLLGRKYNPIGPGKMSGLFISPIAPSLDQITFTVNGVRNLLFRNSIVRLDNRSIIWGGDNKIAHRWYYLRSIGYSYKDVVEINFIDAVITTGFNRGLEWYYLNPLSSLILERKHQLHWSEGADSSSAIGLGDNDNHFVGGNISIQFNQFQLYNEWLIDEWQLSNQAKDNMQTVFGFLIGINYNIGICSLLVEYALASPWVYINRALYGSLELHHLPIGLRSPNSESIDLGIIINLSEVKSVSGQIHWEERGEQNFSTIWNAWDNYVNIFKFTNRLPLEYKLSFRVLNGKYFNQITVYNNWLGSKDTFFMITKDWKIDF